MGEERVFYLMVGDDEFGIEQQVKALRKQYQVSNLNFSRCIVGADTKRDNLIEKLIEATTLAIDGGTQLLWIRGLDLGGQHKGQDFESVYRFLEMIADPERVEQLPSVIVISAVKVDGRSATARRLKKSCTYLEFNQPPAWEHAAWIGQVKAAGQQAGVSLSQSVAAAIIERVGNNRRLIDQAVQVLALHGGIVNAALVGQLIPLQHQDGIGFGKALLRRDTATAYDKLEQLLLNQEPPLKLMALLVSQVLLWLKVKAAIAEMPQADNAAIARRIGFEGNPNRVYYLKQEVRGISLPMLVGLLRLVIATEKVLKSGSGDAYEQRALRDLVLAVGKARHPSN